MTMTKREKQDLETALIRATEAEARLEAFLGKHETDTYIIEGMSNRPLPKGSMIRFEIDKTTSQKLDCWLDRGGLYVNGSRRFLITPEASNACRIYLDTK